MHLTCIQAQNKAMKTAGNFLIMLVGLTVSLSGVLSSCAQGTYSQPGYGQTQPDYGQPGYDNGYNNQPGYNNQQGYNQYSGQPQDFYNELGPYGQWVQTPQYGTVWIPNVPQGFQPYATNGHWVVTEYGNTWVSDYAWGWGPFHYGRWFQDPRMGWAWVPGYDWGPAWVSWRSGGGYYGWAPLGPGMNINVNLNIPANYWVFVPQVYITSPNIYSYYVPRPRVVNIYQNTTIINNVYRSNNRAYAYGPHRDEIERVTRRSVPVYRIENAGRPGRDEVRNNNSVGIYRPEVNRNNGRQGSESRSYNEPFDNTRRGSGSRTDSRYDSRNNAPNGGTYNGYPNGRGNAGTYPDAGSRPVPSTPAPTTTYPERGQSPRGGGSYGRPNYEAQQNQPAPQTGQAYPGQSAPQPRRQQTPEPAPAQWGQGNRQQAPVQQAPVERNYPSRDAGNGRVGTSQPQEQPRPATPEQRSPGQPTQGGYQSGRGSSRGNN